MEEVKIAYINAPAPLFLMTLDITKRQTGFEGILCVGVSIIHHTSGKSLKDIAADLEIDLPDYAIKRGDMLRAKYRGMATFGISVKMFKDFSENGKTLEQRVTLIGLLALKNILDGEEYGYTNNTIWVNRMNGYFEPTQRRNEYIDKFSSDYSLRKIKDNLYKWYGVSFHSEKGFHFSLTMSMEELKERIRSDKKRHVSALAKAEKELNEKLAKDDIHTKKGADKTTQQQIPFNDSLEVRKDSNAGVPEGKKKPQGYENFDFSFVAPEYFDVFCRWLEYKKERKDKYKGDLSLKTCYNGIVKKSNGQPDIAEEMVTTAIENNWSGIYAPKDTSRISIKKASDYEFKGNNKGSFEEDKEIIKGWT